MDPGFGVRSAGSWWRNRGGGGLSPLPGKSCNLAIVGFRNRAFFHVNSSSPVGR